MPYKYGNSGQALGKAVIVELDKSVEKPMHKTILVSIANSVQNGIRRCSVQIECKAGCGYLIYAFNEEADLLQEKAETLKILLATQVDLQILILALKSLFPEELP